jgi:hypothetical protein
MRKITTKAKRCISPALQPPMAAIISVRSADAIFGE